jgi:PAS domain S-box-containing protein
MEAQSFLALGQNISLLLAAALLFDLLANRWPEKTLAGQLLAGVGVGCIGMLIMVTPWEPVPGVFIDTRTVLMGICGLFMGSVPTAAAVGVTVGFRLVMGGPGVWAGVILILMAAGTGVSWRHLRSGPPTEASWTEFFVFGLVIHVMQLVLALTLPWDVFPTVLRRIWFPVLLLLPVSTALMGKFLAGRVTRAVMEERIREREEIFSKTFSDHRAIQLLVDPDTGRILDANKAAESFYGWTVGELRQKLISDINRLSEEAVGRLLDRARMEHQFRFEFRHYLADGTMRFVEVFSSRIKVRGVDILHSIIHDVTDKTLAEAALHESENRLQLAVEATGLGLWDWDLETGDVVFNEKWARMLGYSLEELEPTNIGTWQRLCHKEDLPSAERLLEDHMAGLTDSYECELRMLHKDGHVVWIADRGKVYEWDGQGKPVRMLGTHRNITDRRLQQDAIKREIRRHEILMESSNDGILIIDDKHRIVEANRRFAEMLGYSAEELVGMHTWEYVAEFDEEAIREGFGDFAQVNMVIESRHRRKDGRILDVEVSLSGVGFSDEDLVLAIVRDITRRKRVQAELRMQKEKAEAASSAKSEFLANMSHEIRTPMNGILGMLQLLQTTSLDLEQADYIHTAIQSSKRLSRLLSDILDLSRVEAGKLSLQSASFDLEDCMRQAEELFEYAGREKGVALDVRVDPDISHRIIGDPTRLQQVLINLMGNSLKFTSDGSITMEAQSLSPLAPGTQRVLFVVSDTGEGIPEDKLDSLFLPFTQVHQGYTREHQGAGLGLSICKRLIELMGGTMAFDSVPGQGTTVYFSLSFQKDVLIEEADSRPGPPPAPHRPLSILLAEDDRVNHIATKRLLEKMGHAVTGVGNGAEALEAMGETEFDLVLMDIQMPVMNGMDAIRAIRDGRVGKRNASIPIIALTAYAMAEDEIRISRAGTDGYLAKPVSSGELQATLARLF